MNRLIGHLLFAVLIWANIQQALNLCMIENEVYDDYNADINLMCKISNDEEVNYDTDSAIYSPNYGRYLNIYKINLTISHSTIRIIKPNFISFDNSKVISLIMNNLYIEILLPGAFDSLNNLERLELKGNEIKELPAKIFSSLPNLQILQLSDNSLHDIEKYALHGINNISIINMTNNNISELSANLFDSPIRIDKFYLNMNKIESIGDMLNLKINNLYLNSNQLKYVNFSYLPSTMNTLDLSNNSISNISYSSKRNFNLLNLDNNKIQIFEKVFGNKELHLSFNNLTVLTNEMFYENSEKIYLHHNYISQINFNTFYNLINLQVLSLQHNNLDSLPSGCFKDLVQLKELNLAYNNLKILQHGIFDNLNSLIYLNLSNNQLINYDHFLMHNLRILDLSENQLSDLDVERTKIHFRGDLYLNGNNWKCNRLRYIFHYLNGTANISLGNSFRSDNVRGIACELDDNEDAKRNTNVDVANTNFRNSDMYNFFNKEFRNSNFYKYLENLKRVQVVYTANQNQSEKAEKIVRNIDFESSTNYNAAFVIIIILLIASLLFKTYEKFFENKSYFRSRIVEDVQELN